MDGGEGHFVARFRRVGENPCVVTLAAGSCASGFDRQAAELYRDLFTGEPDGKIYRAGDRLQILPKELPGVKSPFLRAGVELGWLAGKRIEPSHSLFMSRSRAECRRALDFAPDSPELAAFLRGEEIDCPGESGYTAVCVNGVITGFGKASGGRLKNHYPKGLRNLR